MTVTIAELFNRYGWGGLFDAFAENDYVGKNLDWTPAPNNLRELVKYSFERHMELFIHRSDANNPLSEENATLAQQAKNDASVLTLTLDQYDNINFRHGPRFYDSLCEQAYRAYEAVEVDEKIGWSEESTQKAIEFLSRICDYYLSGLDGDFMEIKRSNTWQR